MNIIKAMNIIAEEAAKRNIRYIILAYDFLFFSSMRLVVILIFNCYRTGMTGWFICEVLTIVCAYT